MSRLGLEVLKGRSHDLDGNVGDIDARLMVTLPSSSGRRSIPRTCVSHSGSSSRSSSSRKICAEPVRRHYGQVQTLPIMLISVIAHFGLVDPLRKSAAVPLPLPSLAEKSNSICTLRLPF